MAKIVKLGNRPKNFKHIVKVPMLDGEEGTIPLRYKYRTKTEYGEFIDAITAAAEVVAASESNAETADEAKAEVKKFSLRELMEKTKESNADFILDAVDSWELDMALSRDSVKQLCDELPAAAVQIMEDYAKACTQGRLGN